MPPPVACLNQGWRREGEEVEEIVSIFLIADIFNGLTKTGRFYICVCVYTGIREGRGGI